MSIDTQATLSQAQSSLRNRSTTSSKAEGELEKQDFMNLFLTQMSNQNPVDPMNSGAMMAQLAQLGSMEQLENLNSQMSDLNATQKEVSRFQALQFLDKDVLMQADEVEVDRGGAKPVYYMLDKDADNMKVTIEDQEGMAIFSQQLGLTTAGKHQFVWDGKNEEGTPMADGKYKIRFVAYDTDGNSSPLQIYNFGRVSQVEYRDGQPWVKTQNETIPLSKVKNVDTLSKRRFGNAVPLPMMRELAPKGLIVDKTDDQSVKK
ncbi:MAG: hypothetical protein GY866_25315 [Proteobacteria bacterium]|nr:hypothetical protein [Pseudomonadota bacterium]